MAIELTPAVYDTIVGTAYRVVSEQFALHAVSRKEFDALTTALGDLAAAQARTERSLHELAQAQARTEQRVEELAQAQVRTEQRLDRVEAAIERLTEAQTRSEERLTRVEGAIDRLTAAYLRMDNTMGGMRGRELERAYRDKAPSYFGRMLRQVRVVAIQDIEDRLRPLPAPEAFDDLL